MMVCGRTILKSGLRLRAAQQRGTALNVVDLPIVEYLLEELVDSRLLCPTMLILRSDLTKG
jgi:hypothetical protein